MELTERFKYLMKLNNMSASTFADEIGVQRSSMSHILSGRNKPSLEFIQKVLNRFPKVSADWLIAGITATEKMELPENEPETPVKEASPLPDSIPASPEKGSKTIQRIVVFYADNTFEEFKS